MDDLFEKRDKKINDQQDENLYLKNEKSHQEF